MEPSPVLKILELVEKGTTVSFTRDATSPSMIMTLVRPFFANDQNQVGTSSSMYLISALRGVESRDRVIVDKLEECYLSLIKAVESAMD